MKKLLLTTTLVVGYVIVSIACTNLLVGKKASTNGSTLISYAADSYGLYGELYHWPAQQYRPGELLKVYEWDTGKYLGETVGKLGFGFMRLPTTDAGFDLELINRMVDRFLEAGFTYFDTAYVYMGSEEAMRETLVKRHPRDKYTIASKLNMMNVMKSEDMQTVFETSSRGWVLTIWTTISCMALTR